VTKTSLMLGCGEAREEVLEAMALLREAGVDVVTLGQYMRPTKKWVLAGGGWGLRKA
jgi:lipoic acid synthetase